MKAKRAAAVVVKKKKAKGKKRADAADALEAKAALATADAVEDSATEDPVRCRIMSSFLIVILT